MFVSAAKTFIWLFRAAGHCCIFPTMQLTLGIAKEEAQPVLSSAK